MSYAALENGIENVRRWIEMITGEAIEESSLLKALVSGRLLCLLVIRLYTGLGMKQRALSITISDDRVKNIKTFLR